MKPVSFLLIAFLLTSLGFGTACGQSLLPKKSSLGAGSAQQPEKPPVQLSTRIECEADRRTAYLIVAAKIPPGGYLYSLTQPGPSATKLEIAMNDGFQVAGAFRPQQAPHVEGDPGADDRIETHHGDIEFHLPILITHGTNPEDLVIDVRINGQFCQDNQCHLIQDRVLSAKLQRFRLPEHTARVAVPVNR